MPHHGHMRSVLMKEMAQGSGVPFAGHTHAHQAVAFDTTLRLRVIDGQGNPIPGVQVTFEAPSEGASLYFVTGTVVTSATSDSTMVTVTSDDNGFATSPLFLANNIVGNYIV